MTSVVAPPRPERSTSFTVANPRVDVIFNCVSGTRDPKVDLATIRATLEKSFQQIVVWETTPEKSGEELGQEALADGATVLVACGGDGTVSGVATAIRKSTSTADGPKAVLGVVPRGTANALCAALDIPSNVKSASKMVASGHARQIDLPIVIHRDENVPSSMLLLCGIGIEAETVKRAHRGMKRSLGAIAYAVAGIASIWQQPFFKANIVLHDVDDNLMFAEGRTQSKELQLTNMKLKGITIANAAPATSVLAQGIGEVRPDDGLLEIVCITSRTPLGMIGTMLSMFRSALLRTRETRGTVYGLRARKVEINCEPPQRIVIDGEDAGVTPIVVEIGGDAGNVGVIAPKAGTVTRRRRRLSRSLRRLWRNARGATMLAVVVEILRSTRKKAVTS